LFGAPLAILRPCRRDSAAQLAGDMTQNSIIFEYVTIGNSVKVTAMDPETLVEVSIVGPAGAPQAHLRAAAVRAPRSDGFYRLPKIAFLFLAGSC
jgi:hypothetical protein